MAGESSHEGHNGTLSAQGSRGGSSFLAFTCSVGMASGDDEPSLQQASAAQEEAPSKTVLSCMTSSNNNMAPGNQTHRSVR
eukprot:3976612-Amphidinium_carterae.1